MASASLRAKIVKLRELAPYDLPKARLCANLILSSLDGKSAIQLAVDQLKQGLGNNWSATSALQFMSGRRGEFAADCAEPHEQARLYLAHLVAKQVCSSEGLGAVVPPDGIDVARLHALVAAATNQFQ